MRVFCSFAVSHTKYNLDEGVRGEDVLTVAPNMHPAPLGNRPVNGGFCGARASKFVRSA
jgi:hypothetical protein